MLLEKNCYKHWGNNKPDLTSRKEDFSRRHGPLHELVLFPMAMFQYWIAGWASVSEGAERTLGGSGEAGPGDAQASFNPRS